VGKTMVHACVALLNLILCILFHCGFEYSLGTQHIDAQMVGRTVCNW